MIGRAPVIAIAILLMTILTLYVAEYFIPLAANFQFRTECRKILLTMEEKNQLTEAMRTELHNTLASRNFTVISISAPHTVKRGLNLNLNVVVDYKYSKLTGIFKREDIIKRMVYNKYTIARKVLN